MASVGSRSDTMDVAYLGTRGFIAAAVGATAVAGDMDRRLAEIEAREAHGTTWVHRARIAMARGDRSAALAFLRAGGTRGIPRVPTGIDMHSEPVFAPLRGDPAFQAALRSGE